MLLITPPRWHLDRWLKQGVKCATYATCALAGVLLLSYFLYPWKSNSSVAQSESVQSKDGKVYFPYEAIGSGGLALRPHHALGWVSRLAEELVLIAYNSRPDTPSHMAKILVSLKNGKQQLTLANGHMLYLKESEQGKGLLSSETPTALWVKPLLLDNGAVLVEAGRTLGLADGQNSEEKGQFIVAQQGGVPNRYNPTVLGYVKEIKSARGFSRDQLLSIYGGREYALWKDKAVLELTNGETTYACFVSAGDYLLYEGGEWRVVPYEGLRNDLPIAYVRAANGAALEIDVWDEVGFCPVQTRIEMQRQAYIQLKSDAMPSRIRLRNNTQISCALGKRRVILREGDWLLKTSTGWRNLRKAEEIEQYLLHRLKGELFVFDGIEKEQGRIVMKGYLFDETRTQAQALALPIDSEKPQGKSTRKRRQMLPGGERRVA